jgi:hypothetical protein
MLLYYIWLMLLYLMMWGHDIPNKYIQLKRELLNRISM